MHSTRPPQLVTAELPPADPLTTFGAIAHLPYAFMLHSALPGPTARWSFFGAEPFAVLRAGSLSDVAGLCQAMSRRAPQPEATGDRPPFCGGMVGYCAYDLGRRFERLPSLTRDDLGLPDFVLAFYDVVAAFDHRSGRARLFSSGLPLEGSEGRRRAQARLDRVRRQLEGAPGPAPVPRPWEARAARSTFTQEGYLAAILEVKERIRAGDIFQANLSQRWSLPLEEPGGHGPALRLYRALMHHSPAPFAAFYHAEDHALVSASPERFLQLRGESVRTQPIKGTRPRGATAASDEAFSRELVASEKDRAENVMIVDVSRNDLGRVCRPGSVRVDSLCALEAYPQVFHLVSTVSGRLSSGRDFFDLMRASFPGSSVTGAPKIRAMEILESLEPVRRHVYTGALGYLDWSGDADWNLLIRTALITSRALHFSTGGGIVADSDPEQEFLETLHKAEGMRLGLEEALGPVLLSEEVLASVGSRSEQNEPRAPRA